MPTSFHRINNWDFVHCWFDSLRIDTFCSVIFMRTRYSLKGKYKPSDVDTYYVAISILIWKKEEKEEKRGPWHEHRKREERGRKDEQKERDEWALAFHFHLLNHPHLIDPLFYLINTKTFEGIKKKLKIKITKKLKSWKVEEKRLNIAS